MHGLVIIFWFFIALSVSGLLADFLLPFIIDSHEKRQEKKEDEWIILKHKE